MFFIGRSHPIMIHECNVRN